MLEKIPAPVGRALRGLRAGHDRVASERAFAAAPDAIFLESPAFEDGGRIPRRYTADGEKLSPPLRWIAPIKGAESHVLIVEDPDAPTLEPLVHLLAWDLAPGDGELPEGRFRSPHHEGFNETLGRNSFLQPAYLPPDPPRGHGPHDYVFQIFALDRRLGFTRTPSLKAVIAAMQGHVLAKGVLSGSYERRAI